MGNTSSSSSSSSSSLGEEVKSLESTSTSDDSGSGSMKLERTETNVTNVAVEGELVCLLKIDNTDKMSTEQCIDHLHRIIKLLPRHIEYMTSHSDDIIDMHKFGLMCMDIYTRYKLVKPDSFNFNTMPTNQSVIADDAKLLHHLKIISDILRGYTKQDLRWGWTWNSLQSFLHHMAHMSFSPHADQLRANFNEISYYLYIRDDNNNEWGTTMRCIRWYIETLLTIIDMIKTNALSPLQVERLDECVLAPGCKMFNVNISREMSPIEILMHLKMKAEGLLQHKNMVINCEQQKKIWMNASMHKEMENKAKALLTDTSIPITNKDRSEMLTRSGLIKPLLKAFVKPPPSQRQQMQSNELNKFNEMILRRISSKKPGGSRKTKRRHKRSRRK